jgi:hypothetical protein
MTDMNDWAEKYLDLMDENNELLRKHGRVLKRLLELSRDHKALLRQTIAMTQRATELENLIEEHGLCPAPLNTPKVPESFEEWERQQQKGGEG